MLVAVFHQGMGGEGGGGGGRGSGRGGGGGGMGEVGGREEMCVRSRKTYVHIHGDRRLLNYKIVWNSF